MVDAYGMDRLLLKDLSSSSSSLSSSSRQSSRPPPTYLIFGCNTDIGKTVLTAGMIRSAAATPPKSSSGEPVSREGFVPSYETHYIKPLQCGGSDENFVRKHCRLGDCDQGRGQGQGQGQDQQTSVLTTATTLFRWETPSSPHLAARIENKPLSDQEVLDSLNIHLQSLSGQRASYENKIDDEDESNAFRSIWIETAGGVLSPSSSSPLNTSLRHAYASPLVSNGSSSTSQRSWGWIPQADLYMQLVAPPTSSPSNFDEKEYDNSNIQVVLIGDGRLGGISATLSSLESLMTRKHYSIAGIVQICRGDDTTSGTIQSSITEDTNQEALKEYAWSMANRLKDQDHGHLLDPIWKDPENSIVSVPQLPPEPEPL
eukprot:CAMPEP_0113459832 /NCGR_PEP_ID=MMETSP0014_2-20120614/10668_1 /TAXON_ID=2857 /ORGANISM="Nitzschia sp." /LENGTH=371 /DNA_ID=CAMNT_0000351453 /DNA_START=87 /DNA_END=1198 /DNA_ORIENTATION=- /assembly_acc=CAM_ASM_000159